MAGERPDGTGLELIRHARGKLKLRTPAIAMTGFGMEEDIARARGAGFDIHLTKPINFVQLEEAIQRVIDAR